MVPHIQVQQNEKHFIFSIEKQSKGRFRICADSVFERYGKVSSEHNRSVITRTLASQGLGYLFILLNIKLTILKMIANLPPLEILNLIPKSPLGPPGLWLAVRMIPPMALIFLMMQDTAGVERIPFCPITKRPI